MDLVGLALNVYIADAGLGQVGKNHFANLAIFRQLHGVLLAGSKPAALVLFDDAQAEADGMYFATQVNLLEYLIC
jgi:hypothetical protein